MVAKAVFEGWRDNNDKPFRDALLGPYNVCAVGVAGDFTIVDTGRYFYITMILARW